MGHEKVLRYCLFIGISVRRCWLRGQRQVPGGQGKSSSASRHNEGLAWISHTIFERLIYSVSGFFALSAITGLRGAEGGAESCDFSGRGQRKRDLSGLGDDAAGGARGGGACQAGEPRVLATALRR